jgi:hypothetical protein
MSFNWQKKKKKKPCCFPAFLNYCISTATPQQAAAVCMKPKRCRDDRVGFMAVKIAAITVALKDLNLPQSKWGS